MHLRTMFINKKERIMAKNKNVKKGMMRKDYIEKRLQEEKQKKYGSEGS